MASELQNTAANNNIEAQLKWSGFEEVKPGLWRTEHDKNMYCVDLNTGEIFRFDGVDRITEDADDEYLAELNNMMKLANTPAKQVQQEIVDEVPQNAVAVVDTGLPALSDADIVRPAVNAQAALQAWNEFQALKGNILAKSDLHRIQGKDFVKKSGWRKFATFYNLTDRIVEEKRISCEDGTFIWKVKIECRAPNGRITEGVAMCSSKEKNGARIEHDTYSTAHTRAKNRAISDMIAAGEVSAEEMA